MPPTQFQYFKCHAIYHSYHQKLFGLSQFLYLLYCQSTIQEKGKWDRKLPSLRQMRPLDFLDLLLEIISKIYNKLQFNTQYYAFKQKTHIFESYIDLHKSNIQKLNMFFIARDEQLENRFIIESGSYIGSFTKILARMYIQYL